MSRASSESPGGTSANYDHKPRGSKRTKKKKLGSRKKRSNNSIASSSIKEIDDDYVIGGTSSGDLNTSTDTSDAERSDLDNQKGKKKARRNTNLSANSITSQIIFPNTLSGFSIVSKDGISYSSRGIVKDYSGLRGSGALASPLNNNSTPDTPELTKLNDFIKGDIFSDTDFLIAPPSPSTHDTAETSSGDHKSSSGNHGDSRGIYGIAAGDDGLPISEEKKDLMYKELDAAIRNNTGKYVEFIKYLAETGSFEWATHAMKVGSEAPEEPSAESSVPRSSHSSDEDSIFSCIEPLVPTPDDESESKLINAFMAFVNSKAQSKLNKVSPLPLHSYPRLVRDAEGKPIGIDKKEYYSGVYLEALELACLLYRRYLYGVNSFPEGSIGTAVLFDIECCIIFLCIHEAYEQLGLTTYDDIEFRIVHLYGMVIPVLKSVDDARNVVKSAAQVAILKAWGFHFSKKKEQNSSTVHHHRLSCLEKSQRLTSEPDRPFVEPYNDKCKSQVKYTNEGFLRAVMRALYIECIGGTKFGRNFSDMFGDTIPLAMMALVAAALKCALDEYTRDGGMGDIKFDAAGYMFEYDYHIREIQKVYLDEVDGKCLRNTLKKWARVGCQPALRHTVREILEDLRELEVSDAE